jgi:hypothetical protein
MNNQPTQPVLRVELLVAIAGGGRRLAEEDSAGHIVGVHRTATVAVIGAEVDHREIVGEPGDIHVHGGDIIAGRTRC